MTSVIPVMGNVMGAVMAGPFDAAAPAFYPTDLGASLLAFWDAERTDLITKDGSNLVSSWKDVVGGYDAVQAIGASKPLWSATGFNGRPCVIPDGVDDEMTLAPVPAGIPTGANGCIIWALVDQTALPADATARVVAAYGGSSNSVNRYVARIVVSGQNRVQAQAGNGSAAVNANLTADFSGRHLAAAVITGAEVVAQMDGVSSTPSVTVPGTTSTRLRLFAATATSPGAFWGSPASAILVTSPTLTAEQLASLAAWSNARRGA